MSARPILWRIVSVLAALASIAFLYVTARGTDPSAHSTHVDDLVRLEKFNSDLNEVTLKIRYGLLNNYDPLASALTQLKERSRALEQGPHAISGLSAEIDRELAAFSASLLQKEALIERFKFENAVLKNSIAYFPLAVEKVLRDRSVPAELREQVDDLLKETLRLHVMPTEDLYSRTAAALENLRHERENSRGALRAALDDVVRHTEHILAYQRNAEALVKQITSGETKVLGKRLTQAYIRNSELALQRANKARLLLLFLSVCLIAYAAYLFRRMRAGAHTLRASEARYRSVIACLAEGVVICDADGRIVDCNASAAGILGRDLEAMRGSLQFDARWRAIRDDGSALPDEEWPPAAVVRTGQSVSRTVVGLHQENGALLWLSMSAQPLRREPDDALAGVVCSFADITQGRLAEESLRIAANALANAGEGVMICEPGGRVISVNKAFSAITGYSADEVVGRIPDFAGPTRDSRVYPELIGALTRAGHWQGEMQERRKNGEHYAMLCSVSAVTDQAGRITHYVTVFTDISEHKQAKARLEFLAHHDPLTQLPNRTLFLERVTDALVREQRHGGITALLFIDLDNFKTINDTLGHAVGDHLLQAVAACLKRCVRETDTVARVGGDEFVILIADLRQAGDAGDIAAKLLDVLGRPFTIGKHELFISASIGISCAPIDGSHVETLLQNADMAMYQSKLQGKNAYNFFSPEMNARALENLVLSNSLRTALERNELELHYQPRIDLATGAITGTEALLRWRHPEHGMVPPARFIPLAEETGLIEAIGEWVLRTACRQAVLWQDMGRGPLRVAVNLSARQFRKADLPQRIAAMLTDTGLAPELLELEITESLVMHEPEHAGRMLAQLHAQGIKIAIDDFGTGYSSLSYLKNFSIDFLKIDRSFISGIPADTNDIAITRAIIALAQSLSLKVIAEGVETAAQQAFLQREGCDELQGYLFSKPLAPERLHRLLQQPAAADARGMEVAG